MIYDKFLLSRGYRNLPETVPVHNLHSPQLMALRRLILTAIISHLKPSHHFISQDTSDCLTVQLSFCTSTPIPSLLQKADVPAMFNAYAPRQSMLYLLHKQYACTQLHQEQGSKYLDFLHFLTWLLLHLMPCLQCSLQSTTRKPEKFCLVPDSWHAQRNNHIAYFRNEQGTNSFLTPLNTLGKTSLHVSMHCN